MKKALGIPLLLAISATCEIRSPISTGTVESSDASNPSDMDAGLATNPPSFQMIADTVPGPPVQAFGDQAFVLLSGLGIGAPLKFSPDGTELIAVSGDQVTVLRTLDGTTIRTASTGSQGELRFSPDAQSLVQIDELNRLRMWSIRDNKLLWRTGVALSREAAEKRRLFISDLAFAEDGQKIVTVNQRGQVMQYESKTGKALGKPWLPERLPFVEAAGLSVDGSHVSLSWAEFERYSLRLNGDVSVWNVRSRKRVMRTSGPEFTFNRAHPNTQGTWLLMGDSNSPHHMLLAGSKNEQSIDWGGQVFEFTRDGRSILANSGSNRRLIGLSVVDLATEQVSALVREYAIATTATLDASGDRLASHSEGIVQLWDLPSRKETARIMGGEFAPIFSPDGQYMAAKTTAGMVRVWRVGDWRVMRDFKGACNGSPTWARRQDEFHINASWRAIAFVETCGKLSVWDMQNGRQLHAMDTKYLGKVRLSDDGRHVAMLSEAKIKDGGSGQALVVHDLQKGTDSIVALPKSVESPYDFSVGFSSDGHVVLYSPTGQCFAFEAQTLKELEGYTATRTCLERRPSFETPIQYQQPWLEGASSITEATTHEPELIAAAWPDGQIKIFRRRVYSVIPKPARYGIIDHGRRVAYDHESLPSARAPSIRSIDSDKGTPSPPDLMISPDQRWLTVVNHEDNALVVYGMEHRARIHNGLAPD